MDEIKFSLRQKTIQKFFVIAFFQGIKKLRDDKKSLKYFSAIVSIFIAVAFINIVNSATISGILGLLNTFISIPVIIIAVILLIALFGYVPGAIEIFNNLTRIGMINTAFEAPIPIHIENKSDVLKDITFWSKGFPLSEWENWKEKIETALNIHILGFSETASKREITLHCASADYVMPTLINWDDNNIIIDDFSIVLGEYPAGKVSMNLAKIPHWLIGGTTGNGKTALCKLIVHQSLLKGAQVYIVDWKYGVDYQRFKDRAPIISDNDSLLKLLDNLTEEISLRAQKFIDVNSSKISEYNEKSDEKMKRIIVIVDETAVILDSKGMSKTEKDRSNEILSKLVNISRLARFTGIHLICSTQRPEVSSVPGSLKGQLDGRLCARMADIASSSVILDDGSAAKLPAIPGRYIFRDNSGYDKIIQTYFLNEMEINYEKERSIII